MPLQRKKREKIECSRSLLIAMFPLACCSSDEKTGNEIKPEEKSTKKTGTKKESTTTNRRVGRPRRKEKKHSESDGNFSIHISHLLRPICAWLKKCFSHKWLVSVSFYNNKEPTETRHIWIRLLFNYYKLAPYR